MSYWRIGRAYIEQQRLSHGFVWKPLGAGTYASTITGERISIMGQEGFEVKMSALKNTSGNYDLSVTTTWYNCSPAVELQILQDEMTQMQRYLGYAAGAGQPPPPPPSGPPQG